MSDPNVTANTPASPSLSPPATGEQPAGAAPLAVPRPAAAVPRQTLEEEAAPSDEMELGAAGAALGLGTAGHFGTERAVVPAPPPAPVAATPAPRKPAREPSLLHDTNFRRFWLERLITQTGQGALLYALLIVVADRTDSSFFASLFVACSIIPSIVFGLPAGIVVDALPRQPLLVFLNLARCIFALSLAIQMPGLPGIFAATLGLWTVHQFHSPTESATMAALVPARRYPSAQALANLALTLSQLLGLVILAPLLLKLAGPRAVFGLGALLFVVGALFAALLPRVNEALAPAARRRSRSLRDALLTGWRVARADHLTFEAIIDDVLVSIGLSSLVVIMPLYLKRVLGTGQENTVFVFAPAALGLVVGLRFAPRIGRAIEERRTVALGLIIFAACVASFGFIEPVYAFLINRAQLPIDDFARLVRIPPLVVLAMLLSIPAGFASALVSVTARAVMLARTAPTYRGQVIATQGLIGNLGALVPTLLTGIAADAVGVEPIAVAIAIVIVGGAVIAHYTAHHPLALPSASG